MYSLFARNFVFFVCRPADISYVYKNARLN